MEPNTELYLQGRHVTRDDIHVIRDLLNAHPDWSRSYLSKELCQYWNWRNEIGALKDIACRSLLRRLEQLEQIRLPKGLHKNNSAERRRAEIEQPVFHSREAIECPLKRLYPLDATFREKLCGM